MPLNKYKTAAAADTGIARALKIAGAAPALVQIETAKSGAVTGTLGAIRLASAYDPEKEAETFIQSQKITKGAHVALYGLGLGRHLKHLLGAIGPEGRIVAAEANGSILRAALESAEDPSVFSDSRLTLVCGQTESDFLSLWSLTFASLDPAKTRLVIHMPSFQSIPEDFPKVGRAIEIIQMDRRFPAVMGGYEKENFRRNLPVILESEGLAQLAGTAINGVAAIVGAGPTLDKNIHLLDPLFGMTILCSDTALPVLLNAGITPHIVFTADPQPSTRLHFDLAGRCDLAGRRHLSGRFDIPMALLPTANADVVSAWQGPLFFGFKEPQNFPEPAAGWASAMGVFETGGSVSTMALETAIAMGVKTAILFGQDFGYPGGVRYAQGCVPSILSENRPEDEETVKELDHFGRPLMAPLKLYSYMRDFEKLAGSAETKIVTLSPEGPMLENVEPVPSPLPWTTRAAPNPFSLPASHGPKSGPDVLDAFERWLDEN